MRPQFCMTIQLPALTIGGLLLVAPLIFAADTAAQTSTSTLKRLYNFKPYPDGTNPYAGVVIGSGGVLYGTTYYGGTGSCPPLPGCGTVFSLTPPASPGGFWTETVLHNFTGTDGANPFAGLVIGSGGVLYGTTQGTDQSGGSLCEPSGSCGTVFSLTPPSSPGGAWTETVLYSFQGGLVGDGQNPLASVEIGKGGVLYGTTYSGGIPPAGAGTVFSLTPPASPGGAWTETVLYSFKGGLIGDGSVPSGVVIGSGGVLYGTTYYGGSTSAGYGTVFSLTPPASPGGAWTETVLHNFTGCGFFCGSDGANPQAGVVIGSGGVLYGSTQYGGYCNSGSSYGRGCGTVFSLTPPVSPGGAWTEADLYKFADGTVGASDGTNPYAGVVIGSGGVLFGTTQYGGSAGYGTAFSLTPPTSPGGAWTESILHNFTYGTNDGLIPQGGVVISRTGVLYGTTNLGGTVGYGTVYSLRP